jgi:hypothetical protein
MATTLYKKIFTRFHHRHDTAKTLEINRRKKSTNKLEQEVWRRRKAQARRGCTSVRRGF